MDRGISRAAVYGEVFTLQDVSLYLSLNFEAQIRIERIRIIITFLTVVRKEWIFIISMITFNNEAIDTWCDLGKFLQSSVVIYSAIHVNLDAWFTFFGREITFKTENSKLPRKPNPNDALSIEQQKYSECNHSQEYENRQKDSNNTSCRKSTIFYVGKLKLEPKFWFLQVFNSRNNIDLRIRIVKRVHNDWLLF